MSEQRMAEEAHDRLVALLASLMQDEVPVGVLERRVAETALGVPPRSVELAALANRLAGMVLFGGALPSEEEPEEEPDAQEPVERIVRVGTSLAAEDGTVLSQGMLEWLAEFDERVTSRESFVLAVADAAEEGLSINEASSVQWVFDRQRQIEHGGER